MHDEQKDSPVPQKAGLVPVPKHVAAADVVCEKNQDTRAHSTAKTWQIKKPSTVIDPRSCFVDNAGAQGVTS